MIALEALPLLLNVEEVVALSEGGGTTVTPLLWLLLSAADTIVLLALDCWGKSMEGLY